MAKYPTFSCFKHELSGANDIGQVFRNCYEITKDTGSLWMVVDILRKEGELKLLPFDMVQKVQNAGWQLRARLFGPQAEEQAVGSLRLVEHVIQDIRNKLLMYRFRNRFAVELENKEEKLWVVEPRLRQTLLPLFYVIQDKETEQEFIKYALEFQEQVISDRGTGGVKIRKIKMELKKHD